MIPRYATQSAFIFALQLSLQRAVVWHRKKSRACSESSSAVSGRFTRASEEYDALGRVTSTDLLAGQMIDIQPDSTNPGHFISSFDDSAVLAGDLLTTTKTFYRSDGQVDYTISASGLRTNYLYDSFGRQIGTEENIDLNQDNTIQANEHLSTSQTYGPLGRVTSSTDAAGHTTTYTYDAMGRQTKVTYADGTFAQTIYDTRGRRIATIDPLGNRTDYGYNQQGQLVSVSLPAVLDGDPNSPTYNQMVRPVTTYTYGRYGNRTSITDSDGHTTTFTYDDAGRQTAHTLPGGETQTTTYDQYGRIATHTDFNGNLATYTYDDSPGGDGRLVKITYTPAAGSGKSAQTVTYTYSALGRVVKTTTISGNTINHYGADGHLIETQTPQGTIHYEYNDLGEHTETDTANTDIDYGYDKLGRLISTTVEELNGQVLSTPLVTIDTYDAVGNKATEILPNGVKTVYSYDDLNHLVNVKETASGGTVLFTEHFTLSGDGMRTSAHTTQLQPGGTTIVTSNASWTYDADGRLINETYTSDAATAEDYSNAFTYDLASNRMSKTHTGPGTGADDTITYTYNSDNELIKQVSSLTGETDFTYDANGSQITSTNGSDVSTYSYDVRNKMVGYSNGSTTASYVYDNAGNRVEETVNGVTTYYLTDINNPTGYAQPLEEKSSPSSAPQRTYLLGDHVLGQVAADGSVHYLLTDGHGSTEQLASAAGNITAAYRYNAFGNGINFTPSAAGTVYLFGGDAIYDPASGLYLHGDGARGRSGFRFLQADTYAGNTQDPISLHKYLYANGNPVMMSDPTGKFALATFAIVSSIQLMFDFELSASVIKSAFYLATKSARMTTAANVPYLDKQYAELAAEAYLGYPAAKGYASWHPVNPSDIGLSPSLFTSGSFRSVLYKSGNRYVLAFKGTEITSVEDIYTDIEQAFNGELYPTEYNNAVAVAKAVSAAVGSSSLTMVGHSLGGGLADAAAIATNRNAVTFNAAGLNAQTEFVNGYGSYTGNLLNYSVDGEILSTTENELAFLPVVPGMNLIIPPGRNYIGDSAFTLHSRASVLSALGMPIPAFLQP